MAAPNKLKQAEIAEYLQLLANLVPNVMVVRMQPHQGWLKPIDFCQCEFGFLQRPRCMENIQCPPALLCLKNCQGFQASERRRTSSGGVTAPFSSSGMRASDGIFESKKLQPTHPARRA